MVIVHVDGACGRITRPSISLTRLSTASDMFTYGTHGAGLNKRVIRIKAVD